MRILRLSAYTVAVLAIAGTRVKLPGSDGITVVVADRSASMPRDSVRSQSEAINLITDAMGANHQLAVIAFAGQAASEQHPSYATFSGEVDGKYTGAIATAAEYGRTLTSLARWCAGASNPLPAGMMVRTRIIGSSCRIELLLDPDRETTRLPALPTVQLLRSASDEPAIKEVLPMKWESADMLSAETLMQGSEVILPVVTIPTLPPQIQPPMTLPYSAEYTPQQAGKGLETLRALAAITGGVERLNLKDIWSTLPRRATYNSIQPWLILAAILLFLLEIAIRRGALPKALQPKEENSVPSPAPSAFKRGGAPAAVSASAPPEAIIPAAEEPADATTFALKRAAKRSKERLRR